MTSIIYIMFVILLFLVVYSYVGYGMVLFIWVKIKRAFNPFPAPKAPKEWPTLTLFIASYNEIEFLPTKVENCLSLIYPKEKLKIIFVTDGSNDGSEKYLAQFEEITVLHKPERGGKIGAMNRGMRIVNSEITIFTDANTLLNKEALQLMVSCFTDANVGCVAGEKRIIVEQTENAAGAGEGFYWKYEGTLKKWDSEVGTVVGAAGELFGLRTELFEEVEADTLLDDFMISMRIAAKGYRVVYQPKAIAWEKPTANVEEEQKRKIRICAGGIQSIVRLAPLLNIFQYGAMSFQYISHRVLRWSVTPFAMLLLIPINALLFFSPANDWFITLCWYFQLVFYTLAFIGYILSNRKIKFKVFFIPYFFLMQNISVFKGLKRYLKGNQSVLWEKAKRA